MANKPIVYVFTDPDRRDAEMKKVLGNVLGVRSVRETVGVLFSRANDVDTTHEAIRRWDFKATRYHSGDDIPDEVENCVVTTYKSAKGLEFNHVIIPQLNLGDMSKEQWFVACTRAINSLHVFCRGQIPAPLRNFPPDTYRLVQLS